MSCRPTGAEARLQRQQAAPPQEIGTTRRHLHRQSAHRAQARRRLPAHPARRQPVLARRPPPAGLHWATAGTRKAPAGTSWPTAGTRWPTLGTR